MSRKDYAEVASMLSDQHEQHTDPLARQAIADVTLELALIFKRDNPRFNAGRFFDAAGFPELTGTRMGLN
jgi:hypothetical protein